MITVEEIVSAVSEITGVSSRAMAGPNRMKSVARARHLAMYMVRKHTGLSFPEIGSRFEKDHTTVMSAVRTIETERDLKPETSALCSDIEKTLEIIAVATTAVPLPSCELLHVPVSAVRAALMLPFGQSHIVMAEIRKEGALVRTMRVAFYRDKESLAMEIER